MANLHEIRYEARALLREHGLTEWQFAFDNAKRRFGCCSFKRRTISVSKHLAALNSKERVLQTVKHEIAHALAGPAAHHGRAWKLAAMRLGVPPVRCYSDAEVATPPAPFEATCGNCGKTCKRHRRPRGEISCGKCSGSRYQERFKLTFYDRRGIRR